MRGLWANFKLPLALTFLGFAVAAWMEGVDGFLVVAILAPLEISLSFDNAVVNAKVLKGWSERWRHLFIQFGLPIAVFGMRLVFPIVIVALIGHLGLVDATLMAIHDPRQYAHVITSAQNEVNAFGGAFLLLVFLSWAFDGEKDEHWFGIVESPMARLAAKAGKLDVLLAIGVVLGTSYLLSEAERLTYIIAGLAGVMSFIAAHTLGDLLSAGEDEEETAGGAAVSVVKQGIGGLIYLELLDASCSFDGVIGALAISNKILLVAIGLGIGASYVRNITLMLVRTDTLAQFKYLEHGAMWAIGALAFSLFSHHVLELPDVVTGGVGVGLLIIAVLHSMYAKKAEARSEAKSKIVATAAL
ncbi:hypothetical protein AS149_14720 [Burkholderia cenocepacia]|nr:hypothetical protein AS149_14720 [Burkholderia cenocepacia]